MEKRQSLQQVVLGKLDSYMEKNEKLNFIKIRTFCSSRDMINRVKRQKNERNKKFIMYFTFKKDMFTTLTKDSYNSIRKRYTTQFIYLNCT